MKNAFVDDCRTLLNSLPPLTGDAARLAHRLSEAVDRLEAVTSQARAQFKVGDTHASFNKQTIEKLENPL